MISDLCDFEQLGTMDRHAPRADGSTRTKRLHVLYHLAKGIEAIHALGHYHADVHTENILIKPTRRQLRPETDRLLRLGQTYPQ